MKNGHVTTPFGRRTMTFGMLATQILSREGNTAKSVDKWKIYRALCEARPLLGITDRALAVMNALLSFYPKNELSNESNLVVFPSNTQLCLRSHGMAEQTIRRHLSALVEAGLIARKDSPNGKRYAHRGRQGEVSEAFGFSLSPLLARADEIEHLATKVVAERLYILRLRERISICRRDITKLIDAALSGRICGDWSGIHAGFRLLIDGVSRKPSIEELETLLEKITTIQGNVINQLETQLKTQQVGGNPVQNERHIQNSDSESISESELALEQTQHPNSDGVFQSRTPQLFETAVPPTRSGQSISAKQSDTHSLAVRNLKTFPLGLVLKACPDVSNYGPGGQISNWRDMMSAAIVVRSMLGVSPSAYEEAVAVMGPENTAIVMACILERGGHINSAGGYLRNLTQRTLKGEFALGPMLMSLLRLTGTESQKAG
ncbi:plasmid replication protein RepC [Pararhizobium sp. PWRC1-1]|uniref:plasmid replication protein RepC n=1 Tax=Pararhizobium sp. PWRC1-1 TaxID=2804566 RepID=UPI003CF2A142